LLKRRGKKRMFLFVLKTIVIFFEKNVNLWKRRGKKTYFDFLLFFGKNIWNSKKVYFDFCKIFSQEYLKIPKKDGCFIFWRDQVSSEDNAVAVSNTQELQAQALQTNTCVVCLDKKVSIVFLPCAHLCACAECAGDLDKCPLCRRHFKGYVRAFLSWSMLRSLCFV
jgi:hypothetical protein